jgi:hypothetical protein
MARTLAALVALCTFVTACAPSAEPRGRADTSIITTAELDAAGHSDTYTLVQSLRPQWLRVRGPTSARSSETVKVYLDGSLLGGVQHLRQISTHSVSSLQYLDGLEATQRWGMDHGAGAILLFTRGRT